MKHSKLSKWLWLSGEGSLTRRKEKQLREALNHSSGLQEKKDEIRKLSDLLSGVDYSFRPGFAERTLQNIRSASSMAHEPDYLPDLAPAFRWVALAGVAALALILFSYYFSGGSWSMESIFGTHPFSDEDLISYLLYQN